MKKILCMFLLVLPSLHACYLNYNIFKIEKFLEFHVNLIVDQRLQPHQRHRVVYAAQCFDDLEERLCSDCVEELFRYCGKYYAFICYRLSDVLRTEAYSLDQAHADYNDFYF